MLRRLSSRHAGLKDYRPQEGPLPGASDDFFAREAGAAMTELRPDAQPGRGESVRAAWRLVEAYHALVYYAPERPGAYSALGLRGGWMGYFATRSAALGVVPADVVTACFYGFAPSMVERALPDAWSVTTPSAALTARLEVFDAAVRRIHGDSLPEAEAARLAERLGHVVDSLPAAGAPLFAAHRAAPRPRAAHLDLFWVTTALREYRGDAHVVALRAARLDPAESNALMVALGLVPADQQRYRGWSDDEWTEACGRLRERGWLDAEGHVVAAGHRSRAEIEDLTDRLSAGAWEGFTADELATVTGDLVRMTEPIITAGEVPYPNGMGMAPVADLTVER